MPKPKTAAVLATALAMALSVDLAAAATAPSTTTGPLAGFSTLWGKTKGWQCAPFARLFSGIQLFGNAGSWWSQALGKYARGYTPEPGSVLVFKPYGGMSKGHVAVVSQVVTDRIIQVTHANWSRIGGRRGQVEKDVTVVDVSQGGDWSRVKVFYNPLGDLGTTAYPTYGFIYKFAKAAVSGGESATDAKSVGPLAESTH